MRQLDSFTAVALGLLTCIGLGIGAWALLGPDESQADPNLSAQSGIVAAARGRVDVEGGLSRILASRDGIVREVRVSEGQRVAAGDLLAELDTRAAAIALRAAEAELAEAQARRTALDARRTAQLRQTERMRRAAKEQAISPQALDETEAALAALTADLRLGEAALAQATAKMETARYEMEQRQVRAPVAGIVARRNVKAGDVMSGAAMTEMFVLIPDAPLVVKAEIQEPFVRLLRPGMEAEITAESDDQSTGTGRLLRISPFLDTRRTADATERVDVRVADGVLLIDAPNPFMIGQRVYLRFRQAPR